MLFSFFCPSPCSSLSAPSFPMHARQVVSVFAPPPRRRETPIGLRPGGGSFCCVSFLGGCGSTDQPTRFPSRRMLVVRQKRWQRLVCPGLRKCGGKGEKISCEAKYKRRSRRGVRAHQTHSRNYSTNKRTICGGTRGKERDGSESNRSFAALAGSHAVQRGEARPPLDEQLDGALVPQLLHHVTKRRELPHAIVELDDLLHGPLERVSHRDLLQRQHSISREKGTRTGRAVWCHVPYQVVFVEDKRLASLQELFFRQVHTVYWAADRFRLGLGRNVEVVVRCACFLLAFLVFFLALCSPDPLWDLRLRSTPRNRAAATKEELSNDRLRPTAKRRRKHVTW